MPDLTVLGGSGASVNPGRGCAGILITDENDALVLDLGPNTLQELRKHTDHRRLTGIVISHLHLDHILDLFALRSTIKYNPIPAPAPIPLRLPPGGLGLFSGIAPYIGDDGEAERFFTDVYGLAEYDPDGSIELGVFHIAFHPTVHYVPCWAMRVTHGPSGRSLGYTADTGPSANLETLFAGVDVLLAEASLSDPEIEDRSQSGQMTATEAGELARRAGTGRLIIIHTYDERDPERQRQDAGRAFGEPVVLGLAGTTVSW